MKMIDPSIRLFSYAAILAAIALTSCSGSRPPLLPDPLGGFECLAAFDFNDEVDASLVFDGQACPSTGASSVAACGPGTTDWPVALELVDTDYDGFVEVKTRVAHYRITPPVPPTESDLYLAFEAEDADVDDDIRVAVALNPTGTDTDNRAVVIQPFPGVPPNGDAVNDTGANVVGYEWDGSSWIPWPIPANAVEVSSAYDVPGQYWGVEVRIHLPDLNITTQDFYMATYWRTNAPLLGGGAGENWSPQEAYPDAGGELPNEDPNTWRRYTFGEDCMPDVYISSEWNTCADIYINAEDEDAKKIAINNVNEFHARVHGDDDAGAPTAQDVLVYMDIGHLGNGHAPYAMNYPHNNANINFNGATHSLDAATPEPPTPFDVAAQATNDDIRVFWKPADESPNPFADGEHVCVEAYVYYRDDPNFDNNFGQCNMSFIEGVDGRAMFWTGTGFWWPFDERVTRVLLVPAVVNSASDIGDWRVDMSAEGMEQTELGWMLANLSKGEGVQTNLVYAAPDHAFEPPDEDYFTGPAAAMRRLTQEAYGQRPLLIVKSFVPRTGRDHRGQTYRYLFPGAYVGYAISP